MTAEAKQQERCPWCSTVLDTEGRFCRHCGAAVIEAAPVAKEAPQAEATIPGVTGIDPVLAAYGSRTVTPKKRSWRAMLMGDDAVGAPALPPSIGQLSGTAFQPPSADVKREMLRIEIERLEAEASRARETDAMVARELAAAQSTNGDPANPAAEEASAVETAADEAAAVESPVSDQASTAETETPQAE